jgi:hypothetical protein
MPLASAFAGHGQIILRDFNRHIRHPDARKIYPRDEAAGALDDVDIRRPRYALSRFTRREEP